MHQAYTKLGIEILKIGRAIEDYSLITRGANLFLSISWSVCSELIFSTIEARDVDYSSTLSSIICSLTDDLLSYHYSGAESFGGFSSYAFAYSYLGGIVSQFAISERINKRNLQKNADPTLRYAISVKVHTSDESHYFYYDYAFAFSENDMTILNSIQREDDNGSSGRYKNALLMEIEEVDGANPTKYTTGIIGNFYGEKKNSSNIYEWKGADGKIVYEKSTNLSELWKATHFETTRL